MLERMKEALKDAGLTVYDSVEKVGECRAPYVVCYDNGVEVQPGTKGMFGRHLYEIMCLTPYAQVDALAALETQVRELMKQVTGIRLSGTSGTGAEANYKARAISLTYAAMERLA